MLGYRPPQKAPKEKSNNKKLKLLLENLENIVALLKEELEVSEEENNIIALDEVLRNIKDDYQEPEYEEED